MGLCVSIHTTTPHGYMEAEVDNSPFSSDGGINARGLFAEAWAVGQPMHVLITLQGSP